VTTTVTDSVIAVTATAITSSNIWSAYGVEMVFSPLASKISTP
jgi:hypothetical protein